MLEYIKIGVIALASLANFFIGTVVLKNNPRNKINIVFLLASIFLGCWGLALIFYQFPVIFSSLFWIKATYLAASLYVVAILAFSFVFPSAIHRRAWVWGGIFSFIFLVLTAWLLYFTPLWIIDVVVDPRKGLQTIWGEGYFWWLALLWVNMIWIFVNFIIKCRHASGLQKLQLQYFFVSFIILAISVQIPDVIIPIFFNDTRYFFISATVSFIFSIAVAYSIIRHRLMDIRLVVARSISYSVLVLTLGVICSLGFFLAGLFLHSGFVFKTDILTSTVLVLIIAFSFQPLRSFFEKITNRIFYQHHYDANRLLYNLALIASSSLRLNDLSRKLLFKILTDMNISRGAFVLVDNGKVSHLICEKYDPPPSFADGDLRELIKPVVVTVFDELPENALKKIMRKSGIRLIVPLRTREEHDDILIFGEKKSGNPYSNRDIRLFEVFAPSAAVAISNALSVEQLIQLDDLKSEFITVVSHQLRTPLSVARWNFELILEGAFGHLAPKVKNITKDTYKALMDLNRGLNNLMLALEIEEKKITLRYDRVDFEQDILKEVLASLKSNIKARNIKIIKKLTFKGILKLDRHKILGVVESLLTNALEYSPAGSRVEIFSAAIKKSVPPEFLFSIKNSGIGIPNENKKFVFQKFFRGEEAKKISPNGFGLSLFIARAFIELHGGRIWFEENNESGAVFNFSLPIE
jgi:signal transduction histidine kinase